MEIKLVRRWGSRPAGETVEVDDAQGHWLIDTAFGVRPGDEERSRHGGPGRTYPGGGGPDNLAGGDPTRARMTSARSARVEKNLTGRVQGAPRPVGDVTHVKDENLAEPSKSNRGNPPLASGKTLTEELEEQQAQLEEQESKRKAPAKKADEPEGRKLSQAKK